jgi:hypothetical protein
MERSGRLFIDIYLLSRMGDGFSEGGELLWE